MNTIKRVALSFFILFSILLVFGFQTVKAVDFKDKWVKVDNYAKKGQPRSAIRIIDEIYKEAKKNGETSQILKALIYRVSLQSKFEEDQLVKSIKSFKNEIDLATTPEKQILQSLVAELYHAYYNSNRWIINKRQTLNTSDNIDITTWDAIRFNNEIKKYYTASLENKNETSQLSLDQFNAILILDEKSSAELFPYLYDLLANRAIAYFSSTDYELTTIGSPADNSITKYIIPTPEFANIKINPNSSTNNKVLSLYQSLIKLHIKDNNIEALVDLDLRRLKYAYNKSNHLLEAESNYINSLKHLSKKFKNNPVYVSIAYELANQYYNMGSNYSPGFNKKNKDNYIIAKRICTEAIADYPKVDGSNKCRNLIEKINSINFGFDISVAQLPNNPTLSLVEFRNVNQLYFKIVAGDPKANTDRHNLKEYIQNELRKESVEMWKQELPTTSDHRSHTVEIKIPGLPLGYYIIFASNDSTFSTAETIKYKPIWISNLSYITNSNNTGGYTDMFVLSRESGKSIGTVNITIYKNQYNNRSRSYTIKEVGKTQTDKFGYAKIESISGNSYGTYLFEFDKDGDKLMSENYLNFFKPNENSKPRVKTFLFTDRAIYRPGQTVYYKGIIIEELNKNVSLKTDYHSDVQFINASRKKLKVIESITNENGSFNGSFIIPMGGLNGNMTIKTKTGSVQIKVEDYKRPTFEIVFDTLLGQPRLNDKVTIKGMAISYAGNVVDGAEVKYRVTRQVSIPVPMYGNSFRYIPPHALKEMEISNGNVKTNSNGKFEFNFSALPDNTIPLDANPIFTYEIIVEIADITGEVQIDQTSVKIGNKAINLNIEMPNIVELNNIKEPIISARNLNGGDVNFNAEVLLYSLTPPSSLLNEKRWPLAEFNIITETQFKTDFPHEPYKNEGNPTTWNKTKISTKNLEFIGKTKISSDIFNELEPGDYLLTISGKDNNGNTIETKHFFTLYSISNKKVPRNKIIWSAVDKTKAEPGETITMVIGSSAKKSRVLYEIVVGNDIIQRNWVNLSKWQKVIEIPVIESYRGNFTVNIAMVRFNRLYTKSFNISVPYTNKELDISLQTFRSYLTPGQKEEWNVSISGKNGQKLSSELLASMYDASLDVFNETPWQMNLYRNNRMASNWESNQFHNSFSSTLFMPKPIYYQAVTNVYPAINWFGYQFMGYSPVGYYQNDYQYRKSVISDKSIETMGMMEEDAISPNEVEIQEEIPAIEKEEEQDIIPLRTNFSETAFFYPNLKTDENGNVSFSFTTPDALTEWKIRMLAYSNDLKVGSLEQKIKSQKELMIIPNVPRFVRHGDTLVFTAKIINFTDKEIDANSKIEFLDAISMKPISIFVGDISNSISSKISAKQSASVSWKISIPNDISLLAYRITSSTGEFTDGEERMFPVLTNRLLVTNSLPMNVSSSSTSTFNFNALANLDSSSTIRNYKYTVEFTSNPSWYAVQALPYLNTPKNKNNLALFNMYFANSLSSYIVNSNPKIKSVFEAWKNISPNAFLSNLEKNQELKNSVLNATPWLLNAEDETEQKRRIGLLFDINKMSDEKETILNKLIEEQLSSGAWPWFKGMKEDRFTTQSIVLGMAKLNDKGVVDIASNNKRLQMIRKAVNWLDAKIVSDYKKLKEVHPKTLDKYHLRSSQTQYLYLRSLLVDLIPIQDKSKDAINYYTNQAKKYWLKQTNYLQGMSAIMLHKFGHRNESEAIVRSLKERSLFDKEMGMYWREEAGWNWYQAPVETQAMLIETMAVLDNNHTIIEQLKVWLLKQKQTTHWKTSSGTAEAVYSLLMYGNNALDNTKSVDISVGGNNITNNPDNIAEAGTGYTTTSWSGKEITPQLSEITIKNPNNNIAWGAAYWQYFENMDKIESHDSPLSITKKLFVEKLTNEGPILSELKQNQTLKTGDKVVVRLIISTDRNMEYIHLKDMRATTFEPVTPISGYTYSGGLWYYKNITDVSTDFYIQYLRKGTYVLEYPLFVTQKGDFTNGIATIQSMYAPEFGAHSEGIRISVGK